MITIADIIAEIERQAPLHLAEDYDNPGLLVGRADRTCTGALLTVDVTPHTVAEARSLGFNLIISHHPLIFHGLKHLTGITPVEQAVEEAVKAGIAIYSAHTNLDSARAGVSVEMAHMLGLTGIRPLQPAPGADDGCGLGAVGHFAVPLSPADLITRVKAAFGSPIARCNDFSATAPITTVALCGGSGSSLIPLALAAGAQAYITSDTSYHQFLDNARRLLIVDIGHHESENCSKNIFYRIISEKFPTFAVEYSTTDTNPINYL